MSTGYTIGGDTLQQVTPIKRAGQTFRPTYDHILEWLDLYFDRYSDAFPPIILIFNAGADHLPWGDYISRDRYKTASQPGPLGTHHVRISMVPVKLFKDDYYCITVQAPPKLPPVDFKLLYDKDDATYPAGIRLSSDDSGNTWTKHFNDDHLFFIFGTPPSPPPPPDPPIPNWMMTDIQQILTATGYEIIVTTNVPCHLYMRWTTVEPQEHSIPVERRGLFIHSDKRFCFVSYEDNQQQEDGDTLTHTFIKEPWPLCETRWFYFHGTIDGEASPSTSPIFKKHRLLVPITQTFYSDPHPEITSCDGLASRNVASDTWTQLRDGAGTGGSALSAIFGVSLQSDDLSDRWRYLLRSFFLFDTSSIPNTATILSATLRLRGDYKDPVAGWEAFDISIVTSFPLSNTDIAAADYQNIGTTLLSDTIIDLAHWNIAGMNEFPLNSAGLAAINKTGITKLAVRNNSWDRLNIPPPWLTSKITHIRGYSRDKVGVDTDDGWPQLVITYQPH